MGKISKILRGQNNQGDIVSEDSPKKHVIGSATQAAKEPFIAKTISIRISWMLEVIPQRFFSFSINSRIKLQLHITFYRDKDKIL